MKKPEKTKFIIGIDEVGRGALAGPVVVAAAMVTQNPVFRIQNLVGLKDSKKLSPKQREAWFAYFKNHPGIIFAVARVYPRGIEKMNISRAANLAARKANQRILSSWRRPGSLLPRIFLDGGLYLKNKKWQTANCPNAQTLVKADETITAVTIASIIAKVHRDRFMRRLAKQYPEYGFDAHKGYGTKAHYKALRKHGPSVIHRLTFL